jgi:hypothetical protein
MRETGIRSPSTAKLGKPKSKLKQYDRLTFLSVILEVIKSPTFW